MAGKDVPNGDEIASMGEIPLAEKKTEHSASDRKNRLSRTSFKKLSLTAATAPRFYYFQRLPRWRYIVVGDALIGVSLAIETYCWVATLSATEIVAASLPTQATIYHVRCGFICGVVPQRAPSHVSFPLSIALQPPLAMSWGWSIRSCINCLMVFLGGGFVPRCCGGGRAAMAV